MLFAKTSCRYRDRCTLCFRKILIESNILGPLAAEYTVINVGAFLILRFALAISVKLKHKVTRLFGVN